MNTDPCLSVFIGGFAHRFLFSPLARAWWQRALACQDSLYPRS